MGISIELFMKHYYYVALGVTSVLLLRLNGFRQNAIQAIDKMTEIISQVIRK